ncbi:LCP family protein [Dactylosporangium sp. NPDC049140]|uniref:LCP family protein n=1 Tax=Dactylosporangium sp. NPDC049140 TaxID=3155647 RepID=UPI0034098F04
MDDLLRETFARHEELIPVASPELGDSIVTGARRLRALRRWVVSGLTFLCSILALLLVPFVAAPRPAPPEAVPPSQPINLLIIGIDRGSGAPARVNANAIVLVHVNPGARTAYEVVLPRDLRLELPRLGLQRADGAYLVGGYQLASEAVAAMTGLTLDGGAVVDLAGLESVTRAAGGVDLCAPGCRHFDAHEAVDYLRRSVAAGDDRVLHQYLTELAKAAADPTRLPGLVSAAADALELHLGPTSLSTLATRMAGVDPAAVTAIRLPATAGERGPEPVPGGDGLFEAMQNGRVGAWLKAHPQYALA